MKTITSTEYHNEESKQYDAKYSGSPNFRIYDAITWQYMKACLPKAKKNSLILDAGGGTGQWSIKIAELGYRVVLTDISTGMLDIARQKIAAKGLSERVNIQVSDITNMKEFMNGQFDYAFAEGDPVSYCSSPKKAISELARVTKRGGFVTVSVDNKYGWLSEYIQMKDFAGVERILQDGTAFMFDRDKEVRYPAHVFTFEELESFFKKSRLRTVKRVGKTVFIPPNADISDPQIFDHFLKMELKYSANPHVAGRGGHIAMVGRKI